MSVQAVTHALTRPPARSPRLLAWQALTALAFTAFALHVGVGLGGPGSDHFFNRWLYSGLLVLASAACAARALTRRLERLPWLLLALSLATWTVGDIYYTFAFAGVAEPPFPSVADAFYLAYYPAAYAALVLLVRARIRDFDRAVWLDGLIATLGAAALGATVLVEVVLRATDGSASVVVTNLAYPIGDTLLLALTIGVFALTGWRPGRNWTLLGAGFVVGACADGVFLFQIAQGTYREGTLLDALWPASMLLLAQAAWLRPRRPVEIRLEGVRAFAAPAFFGLIGIGVLAYGHFHRLNVFAVALAVATLLTVVVRTGITFAENQRILRRIRSQAITDALTGLGNRRRLLDDLNDVLADPTAAGTERWMLVIFDLDGFKLYNDSFGHPAGDALLTRLGNKLMRAVEPAGRSYRLGGDEFCVLAEVDEAGAGALLDAAAHALVEGGEGFAIEASYGAVFCPAEASEAAAALKVADQRLYAHKHGKRSRRGGAQDVLLQMLLERHPQLQERVQAVTELALTVAARLDLSTEELEELRRAAELHDVGTIAIPDAILRKPGPLDEEEWSFVRRHPEVGERILSAAPALLAVARIVRSAHERWDGLGYPDGLAGEEIPLGARIVSACDAFVAMTSDRPHRARTSAGEALAELRRGAGTQFDPVVVGVLCGVLLEAPPARRAA